MSNRKKMSHYIVAISMGDKNIPIPYNRFSSKTDALKCKNKLLKEYETEIKHGIYDDIVIFEFKNDLDSNESAQTFNNNNNNNTTISKFNLMMNGKN